MKATDVIKRDHRAAEDLFEQFKKAAHERREAMAPKIFDALDRHEKMEDTWFYPELKLEDKESDLLAELEREQKTLAEEVKRVQALTGDRDEPIKNMLATVMAHAKKEEAEVLPKAEKMLSAEKLEEMGKKMEPESAVAHS